MLDHIRAVFRDGAFYPQTPCALPDDMEVELVIQSVRRPAGTAPPSVTDRDERLRILKRVTERMRNNPLPPEAPPMTREWLHERG